MPYKCLHMRSTSETFWTTRDHWPTTEVIKLIEECSTAILNTTPIKKKDPGRPTVDCSIGNHNFKNTLCDLRASVSVMPKKVFDKLNYSMLMSTSIWLQLASQSVRYPAGIAVNILVKIRNFFVLVDFVVLDMHEDTPHPRETLPEHHKSTHRCQN
jgi:hypothetical protein